MNTNYPVSFKAAIKFVSPSQFDAIKSLHNIPSIGTQEFGIYKKVLTTGAGPCTLGGISNKDQGLFFHFYSVGRNEFKTIMENLQKLSQEGKKISALIAGGIDDIKEGIQAVSYRSYMDLKEFLEKNKISSSIICGQKDNGSFTDLMYVSSKKSKSGQDLWILSHNNYFKDVEIKSVKDLKNAYKYIHISDQDELWINNKKIPKKDIPNTI